MKSQNDYSRQTFLNSVLKSVAISDANNGTVLVLFAMAWLSDFDAPRVPISKSYIKLYTGLSPKTVKGALRWLRNNGVIFFVHGEAGGHGVSPTYEIHKIAKEGNGGPPSEKTIEYKKGGKGCTIGGIQRPKQGQPAPPTLIPILLLNW